ncbi:MAG: hypothetical protein WA510_32275 [Acidobacteriaceae bacterium]
MGTKLRGNEIALKAVLADIAGQGGVDNDWILGDLVQGELYAVEGP